MFIQCKSSSMGLMAVGLSLLSACTSTSSQPTETDWLTAKPGHVGAVLGAEVVRVETNSDSQVAEITVALPTHTEAVETVRIIDRHGDSLTYDSAPLINQYGERIGVVFQVKRKNNRLPPFKLMINDPSDAGVN